MKTITIGNRWYVIDQPLSEYKLHKNLYCIWGQELVVFLEYNWQTGWRGDPTNITYWDAKCYKINAKDFFHTGVNQLYPILDTNSRKIKAYLMGTTLKESEDINHSNDSIKSNDNAETCSNTK